MPVIVVGADTPEGEKILERLDSSDREIRVFVSDPSRADDYRSRGFKVALGDVSDESHVEAAATRCFSAVLITAAITDERERSFADTHEAVMAAWATAVRGAEVQRVIWVTEESPPEAGSPESATVDPNNHDFDEQVAALDDAYSLG